MDNFLKFWFLMNYHIILWCSKTLTFYVFGYINGGIFHFFKKLEFGGTNTMCCIKLFVDTFSAMAKVQWIMSKSKTLLELKVWFHVDCDFIIQIPLDSYIILVWSILLKK